MTDHVKLRELAEKAGGEEWTASDGIVWFADGDSALQTAKNPSAVFLAYTNLGHWPDMLLEEDVAAFAGAANPARVIALLDEILRLRTALADCGNAVGGVVGTTCSLEFLECVTQEVRLVTERLRRERAEALLSAERAREERNREHVRLNAEWMAKCEELRKERDHYQLAAEAEAKFADEFREKAEASRKDIDRYQALCGAVYQMAGTVNAPERFLDALSDGANGELEARQQTDSLLPVDPAESGCFPAWTTDEVEELRKDADRYRWLREGEQDQMDMFGSVWGDSLDRSIDAAMAKKEGA